MLSANHVYPDLGAEIYVLDGPPDHHRLSPEATDATRRLASNLQQDTDALASPPV